MSHFRLLQELSEEVQIITEAKENGKKNLFIEGVFLQCIPNRNGRIYPEEVMHKEVGRYLKEMVKANRAVGELGHPPNPKLNETLISHKITSLNIDGKNVMGRAVILDTPMGNTARGLIEGGVQIGVSSRGLGSLKEIKEGLKEVQDDFRLVTAADIVMDPSAPDAFVQGIMENVEWFYDPVSADWRKSVIAEQTKTVIKKLSKRELEEAKLRLFESFLSQLSEGDDIERLPNSKRFNGRDAAQKGYFVAGKHKPKLGSEIDFYHPSNGDKTYGKVVKYDGSHIHIQQEQNGYFKGKIHKLKVIHE